MKIRSVSITNFRNFRHLAVDLHDHAVVVGPNGVGKSNFIYALRLVLDPSLPDSARQLRQEDFWDGVPRPLSKDARVEVCIELTDFEKNDDQLASLAEHLVETTPMVARLTYVFRAKSAAEEPLTAIDFEFFVHGADREDNRVGHEVRRRLSLDFFHALRDAEGDLAAWRRSPLRPLLERAWAKVPKPEKDTFAKRIESASKLITRAAPLEDLTETITKALARRTDGVEATDVLLGVTSKEAEALIRIVRLLLDEGRRGVAESSLGLANLLFFTLKLLELGHLAEEHQRDHTFVAIEEPEAHLHPHLQRQMFRGFLRLRPHLDTGGGASLDVLPATILVTTHSPHLASIAPIQSLVMLRRTETTVEVSGAAGKMHKKVVQATVAASTATTHFDQAEADDLERYIEASRAELLFTRGVILVEGEAELYLVPRIAHLHGKPLDSLGISVSSVGGTHFASYVRLLRSLEIPFVVITDGDPSAPLPGRARAARLLQLVMGEEAVDRIPVGKRLAAARRKGIFVGDVTFEVDLINSGRGKIVARALKELAPTQVALARASAWEQDETTIQGSEALADIASIGKGRFAQRLASILDSRDEGQGPSYILSAIDFLAAAAAG